MAAHAQATLFCLPTLITMPARTPRTSTWIIVPKDKVCDYTWQHNERVELFLSRNAQKNNITI